MTILLVALLVAAAVAGERTLLHTFGIAFDVLVADLVSNSTAALTISARAGVAARCGKRWASDVICTVFFDKQHCEKAMVSDADRALVALAFLYQKDEAVLGMLRFIRERKVDP